MPELDRTENSTVICALIHYSLAVANPALCVRALEKIAPNPKRPWAELVTEARATMRAATAEDQS